MLAAVHTRYGPPGVVRLMDVPMPPVRDDEVLVKVYATTVNRTDCGFRGGTPFFARMFTGLSRPRVTILGNEFAGQVEDIGPTVTRFSVGDRSGMTTRLAARTRSTSRSVRAHRWPESPQA
jgi:NADPH:quinone reductase-like Zn-dependent oxidoreductase